MDSAHAITLLHLSDLQFGPHHRFESDGALGSLLERLRQDLDERCQVDGLRPDLIVITGDLAEYGKRSELEQVQRFAQKLAGLMELSPRRVVLVPGNHDVNWSLSEAYFKTCEGEERAPEFPYFPKLRHYADFFARFYEGEAAIQFTEKEPWSFFEYPKLKVVVAGLNSTMAESHRAEDHYGFLGEEQIRDFAAKLRPYKEQGFLRIGAVHHDVLHPENAKAAQDLKDLKRILGRDLNVVLHGHIHEEQLGWLDNTVPVLGIGSAGVKTAARPPEVPNQYQIVRVERDRVWLGSRAYVPDQKRWIGDLRVDPYGEKWFVYKNVAFERVDAAFAEGGEEEAKPAADLARVVESYRRHVVVAERGRTVFDLIGFGEDTDVRGGVNLLSIFVPQWAERQALEAQRTTGESPPKAEERRRRVDELPKQVDELIADPMHPWVFLLGAPGAGKTVLTRWLLLKLCAPGERLEPLGAEIVPVRIDMRRFDASYRSSTKKPYHFFTHLDEIHGEMSLSLCGEFLLKLAHEGRLLWIFDGLDEVADTASRRHYTEMIAGLRREYPGCRGLITSRIVGAEAVQPLLEGAGLSTYTMLDFNWEQVAQFLDQWHAAVFVNSPDVGQRRLERLLHELDENPALGSLSGNPLLLTMIASLNRDEAPPRRRHRLYERLVDRMADQWDAGKQLPTNPAYQRFNITDKLRFLRQLAWQMMSDMTGGAGNLIEREDLLNFTRTFCEQTYDEDPDTARRTAEHLVDHLHRRNYVLTLLGGRFFGFVHRTFMEYLAAQEVQAKLRRGELDVAAAGELFAKHWHEAEWQETLTLTCALVQEDRPGYVVTMVQRAAAQAAAWDDIAIMTYLGFAIRCLAEVDRLGQGTAQSFAMGLTDLLQHLILSQVTLGQGPTVYPATDGLRLCGGRWPGFDQLRRWANTDERVSRNSICRGVVYQCIIACGGRDRRVDLLREAIDSGVGLATQMMIEANKVAPWAKDEIRALLDIVASRDDYLKEAVLLPVFARASHEPALVQVVGQLAESSEDPVNRVWAAKALLEHGDDDARATQVLYSLLHAKELWVRDQAALALARAGTDDPIVFRLLLNTSFGQNTHLAGTSFAIFVALASAGSQEGGRFAREFLKRLETVEDKHIYEFIVSSVAQSGLGDFIAEKVLTRIQRELDGDVKLRLLVVATAVPKLQAQAVRMLAQLYESDASEGVAHHVMSAAVNAKHSDGEIDRLLRNILLNADSDGLRSGVANTIIFCSPRTSPELVEDAYRTLAALTRTGVEEGLRYVAAWRIGGKSAQETLRDLAHSATPNIARNAIATLSDEALLAERAQFAEDPTVRAAAEYRLTTLKLLKAIAEVGKLRRARVRLHGRDTGVLEETPTGSRFTYDRAYVELPSARPVSLTMPLRREPYESEGLLPFFANLLPQGFMLEQTAKRLDLRRTDRFGILLAVGGDVMGAVEVLPCHKAAP